MAFRNPIVEGEDLVSTGLRSDNYVENVSGWRIAKDGNVQFENLNVLHGLSSESLATGELSASSLNVDSRYQLPSWFDQYAILGSTPYARGIVGYMAPTLDMNNFVCVGTNVRNYMFGCGFYGMTNRMYRFYAKTRLTVTNGSSWTLRLRYVVGNTPPDNTVDATILNVRSLDITGAGTVIEVDYEYIFNITSANADRLVFIDIYRSVGSGNATVTTPDSRFASYCYCEDLGPIPGTTDNLTLTLPENRITYVSGTPAPPTPSPVRSTKTYTANWSRTYVVSTGATTYDDTASCYQGYYSSARGNLLSLLGFNYAQIQSDLSGYTTMHSIYLKVYIAHTYYNAGTPLAIGTHNYTTKPGSVSGGMNTKRITSNTYPAGGPYSINISLSDGGKWLADEFISGASRGIMFGGGATPATRDWYMYLNGATMANPPQLVIDYTK